MIANSIMAYMAMFRNGQDRSLQSKTLGPALTPNSYFLTPKATPHNSRLTAYAPLRRLRHGICVAKMLDKTSSIIGAFGLAATAPRSPYRHLELCGIALTYPSSDIMI